jgi:hypothetical protein
MSVEVKPSEAPPVTRLVIRNALGFYYDGNGYQHQDFGKSGEPGVPSFRTTDILFAIKYGDTESIEVLIKNHKKWCIDRDRQDLFGLFDSCEVLETYT